MKKTYILVHGAWHGGWAWKKVKDTLEAAGSEVHTPDLPGHGETKLPLEEVTMNAYVDHICELLSNQKTSVILVGHSMAGAVISQVSEKMPSKIEKLVYLCAFLLPNGKSVLDAMGEDSKAEFGPRLMFNENQSGAKYDEPTLRETFYNMASESDITEAIPNMLEYQAIAPLATPVEVSTSKFGSIPRVYIKAMQDKVVTPEMQQSFIDELSCQSVYEVDADHAPFMGAASQVSNILMEVS